MSASPTVRKTAVKKTFDSTWDYEIKADDSPAKLTLAYTDDYDGWSARLPVLGTATAEVAGLYLQQIKAKRIDGDQITVTLQFEGSNSKAPGRKKGEVKRYDCEIATADEHLLTHPHYNDLTAVERRALYAVSNGQELDEAGVSWAPALTGALATHALTRLRKGFVSWKKPSLVYVERSTILDLSEVHFTLLGKKTDVPGPLNGVYVGHWLYIGAPLTNSNDGSSWTCERRWLFSNSVWDTLYDP